MYFGFKRCLKCLTTKKGKSSEINSRDDGVIIMFKLKTSGSKQPKLWMSQLLKGIWSIESIRPNWTHLPTSGVFITSFQFPKMWLRAQNSPYLRHFPRFLFRWNYPFLLVSSPEPSINPLPQVAVQIGFELSRSRKWNIVIFAGRFL